MNVDVADDGSAVKYKKIKTLSLSLYFFSLFFILFYKLAFTFVGFCWFWFVHGMQKNFNWNISFVCWTWTLTKSEATMRKIVLLITLKAEIWWCSKWKFSINYFFYQNCLFRTKKKSHYRRFDVNLLALTRPVDEAFMLGSWLSRKSNTVICLPTN